MARPKSLKPRKKKVTLTIDADIWTRCQNLSSQVPFMNWSELAEISFTEILNTFELSLKAFADGSQPDEVVQSVLDQLDLQYHQIVLDGKAAKLAYSQTNQEPVLSTK